MDFDIPDMLKATTYHWILSVLSFIVFYLIAEAVYNLYLHPLAKYPGPFFAKISYLPNFYHSTTGRRHIWIWQCHQLYGEVFRFQPNGLLFNSPTAWRSILGTKANTKKGKFYEIWPRNTQHINTLTTVDKAVHARKRRVLNTAFSEKSIRSAEAFVIKHVDRWNEIILENNDGKEWSKEENMSELIDYLSFDIMTELSFGKSLDIKEPGENPFKSLPHTIAEYLQVMYPITQSPTLRAWVWLKPRGLDTLFEYISPPAVKKYYKFLEHSIERRRLEEEELEKKGLEQDGKRKDMFHYLFKATDEDGKPGYSNEELHAEANLLVIAGSDTTATVLSGFWFYIVRHPICYDKLVNEILTTFPSVEFIESGPALSSCKYLHACISEALRCAPAGASELNREVLPGGLEIDGEHIPEGVQVGVGFWAITHHEQAYRDPWIFRPERWIPDLTTGVTAEDVARANAAFSPFSMGAWNCAGQKLAMIELLITIARTLYRMDVRLVPGDSLGGGSPDSGWGTRHRDQFQIRDYYVALRDGPRVQFRKRQI